MEILVVWFLFAILASYYSSRKGNGWAGVLFISLLLSPLIGFIVALIQKPDLKTQEAMAIVDGDQKKCLQCAELVKREARVCRFCQYKFVEAAAFLFLITSALFASGCVGDLETSCKVGGAFAGGSSCTFTNKGVLPGRRCVTVSLTKKHESKANPFRENSDEAPVGAVSRSTSICSGTVWGSSTATVEIGYFDPNPIKMCGGWDNCDMDIVAAN